MSDGRPEPGTEKEPGPSGALEPGEPEANGVPADRGSLRTRAMNESSGAGVPGQREFWEVRLPVPFREDAVSFDASAQSQDLAETVRADPVPLGHLSRVLANAFPEVRQLRTGGAPTSDSDSGLEVYVLAGSVGGLPVGTYRYVSQEHALLPMASGDRREQLARQGGLDSRIGKAPAIVVFSLPPRQPGDVATLADRIQRAAGSMGLGAPRFDDFDDEGVTRALGVASSAKPRIVLTLGHPS